MRLRNRFAVVAGTFLIGLALSLTPFSGTHDIAHEAVRLRLRLIGSSIYEYHARTGRWPTRIGDLAKTSLPRQSPYWRQGLDDEVEVIVWHKTLKPDPKDNAGHVLVYHDKGLIAWGGRKWVCWGDLRTEYVKTEDLWAYLKKLKN
jgi:hypothetical protein